MIRCGCHRLCRQAGVARAIGAVGVIEAELVDAARTEALAGGFGQRIMHFSLEVGDARRLVRNVVVEARWHAEVRLRGISVPVKSRNGTVIGAISVSMNIATCSKAEAATKCLPALLSTANTLMLWI